MAFNIVSGMLKLYMLLKKSLLVTASLASLVGN
jgi:hypothetical protein